MFDQQNQIQYPTKSALKNYYIESSLPAYILNKKYNMKPLPKTHQFYKNDQFIWNNPYRSSKKSYKYYHKQQDQYRLLEQKLKRQDEQKKRQAEQNRINELKMFRLQDRNRLLSRKSERSRLQNSVYRQPSHALIGSYSSKKQCRPKTQLQNMMTTESAHHYTEETNAIVERMARSVILREKESRAQQLRDRRSQIEDLIKKSGQSLKTMSRPITATKKSKPLMFRER